MNELKLLQKENKLRADCLSEPSRKLLKEMDGSLQGAWVGAFDRAVIQKELIGVALAAEQQGGTMQGSLSSDMESLCRQLAEGAGKASVWESICYWGGYYCRLMAILFLAYMLLSPGYRLDVYSVLTLVLWPFVAFSCSNFSARRYTFATGWRRMMPAVVFVVVLGAFLGLRGWLELRFGLLGTGVINLPPLVVALVFGAAGLVFASCFAAIVNKQAAQQSWADR